MPLSPGAVELPPTHLSARVAWHDTDWTGRVCAAPAANHACTVLKNIKGKKDADAEERVAGQPWPDQGEADAYPPCAFERAGFMRPRAITIERTHTYATRRNRASHGHFAPTLHRMPAYSFEAVPYRWTQRKLAVDVARQWGIELDQGLEDRADEVMQWSSDWLQDHRNQLAMLDSFFSAITPGESLVFVYAKDAPLLEDPPPGARILMGVGRVEQVDPWQEWSYSGDPSSSRLRSVLWERAVHHSIRPSHTDGFLLPYHELLKHPRLAGEDLAGFVAHAPGEHFEEFSYVCELVSHDAAIAALVELARVVDLLPGLVDGPWDRVATWLSDRIADTWKMRGPYPGLGSALAAAGLERGPIVAHRVVRSLADPTADPWPELDRAIRDAQANVGPAAGLVGRVARQAWERLTASQERSRLLRLLARFPLTAAQARRLFDRGARATAGIEASDADLLANPYLLYEVDRGRLDSIGLHMIDRGMFPRDAAARAVLDADPLPDAVTEAVDDRRVRAACTLLLETAAAAGHTLLDEPGLRKRLAALALDPPCDPTSDLFELAAEGFVPVLRETPLAKSRGRGWQLARLADAADLIAGDVARRVELGPIEVQWDWRDLIDCSIDEPADPDDSEEEAARAEKALALREIARSRISALVGPAGTGKTTLLRALCTSPEVRAGGVLLLAPTGKARVQLGDRVGARALTLAQFLRGDRWDYERGYRINSNAPRNAGYRTVVVDEASMLTEEMLAALVDALEGVERLVLCGDHRQLPPIGPGRPFADLVRHLSSLRNDGNDDVTGGGLAELTIGRRQRSPLGGDGARGRDDLAVASLFSVEGSAPAADETLTRVLSGGGDGTLEIVSWTNEDDLHAKVARYLVDEIGIPEGDSYALRASLGATGEYEGRPSFEFGRGGLGAENWQLLSPIRSRAGGIAGLNRLVRHRWRAGDASVALRSWEFPPPMGSDEVLFYDKVMCVANHPRRAWRVEDRQKVGGDVANGEIGMAVHWPPRGNGKPEGLKVEFSTQPGLQFTFWTSELNAESERKDVLEVAYAVTIHKAQGSQFERTLVVVPNPCPILSLEMLYTALTRQRKSTVLFIQGPPSALRDLGQPSRSETGRRLTRLFRAPDPFETPEGLVFDAAHVHRTANGEMVMSKSEVIVADTFKRLDIPYVYEQQLQMADGTRRKPDFTLYRPGQRTIYWEHLGKLGSAGYRADWEVKRAWYAEHGILPWLEGGGPDGVLVWSDEKPNNQGIDSQAIEQRVREVMG